MSETDPTGRSAHDAGSKLDAGKIRSWLCIAGFSRALQAVAEVTTRGAEKYTPNGWATVPNAEERYMDAFARHTLSLGSGERYDRDTGCLHKAQMIWNLLASLELEMREACLHERRQPGDVTTGMTATGPAAPGSSGFASAPGDLATGMNAEDAADLRRMRTPRKIVNYPVLFSAPLDWPNWARTDELVKEFGCQHAEVVPANYRLRDGVLYITYIMQPGPDGSVITDALHRPCRIVSRGWKFQEDFDTGPPGGPL